MTSSNHMNLSRLFDSYLGIAIYENKCNDFFFLKSFQLLYISTRNDEKFLHGGGVSRLSTKVP